MRSASARLLAVASSGRLMASCSGGKGSGTTKFNLASLTADGQDAQLCTTGDLTWTVDRVIKGGGTGAARSARMSDGIGFLKLRVRHGVTEIVKLVEP